MKQKLFILGPITLLCSLLLSICVAAPPSAQERLMHDLAIKLDQFRKTHSLSYDELNQLVGNMAIGGKAYKKGRLGIVENDIYIQLENSKNGLMIGKDTWEGLPADRPELVLVEGGKVIESFAQSATGKPIILLFSAKEVQFINLATNFGAVYSRN